MCRLSSRPVEDSHMARPNSYRLIDNPITVSCIKTDFEKQTVLQTERLIRARKVKG